MYIYQALSQIKFKAVYCLKLIIFIFNPAFSDVTICLVQIREQLQAELNRYQSRITDLECVLSQQGQVILQHLYTRISYRSHGHQVCSHEAISSVLRSVLLRLVFNFSSTPTQTLSEITVETASQIALMKKSFERHLEERGCSFSLWALRDSRLINCLWMHSARAFQ